jgi:hypothetical protein
VQPLPLTVQMQEVAITLDHALPDRLVRGCRAPAVLADETFVISPLFPLYNRNSVAEPVVIEVPGFTGSATLLRL